MYRKCKTGSNKIEEFFQQFATGTYVYALQSSNRDGTSNIFGVLDAVFFYSSKEEIPFWKRVHRFNRDAVMPIIAFVTF